MRVVLKRLPVHNMVFDVGLLTFLGLVIPLLLSWILNKTGFYNIAFKPVKIMKSGVGQT